MIEGPRGAGRSHRLLTWLKSEWGGGGGLPWLQHGRNRFHSVYEQSNPPDDSGPCFTIGENRRASPELRARPQCDMTVLTQTPAISFTHTHTSPVDSFQSKRASHANKVGRQDPRSAYLSEGGGGGGTGVGDRQRRPHLLFWWGLRVGGVWGLGGGGAEMDPWIGWESETLTIPPSPPTAMLHVSLSRSDRPDPSTPVTPATA